jgi:hypothetical protein
MISHFEERVEREFDLARQYSFQDSGVNRSLHVFEDGETLLTSLGVKPLEAYDWIKRTFEQTAPVNNGFIGDYVRLAKVETDSGIVGVCIKESVATELANSIMIGNALPTDGPYAPMPLKVYFGTQNTSDLYSEGNLIVMEWVEEPRLEDLEYSPEELLREEAILRHMIKWQDLAEFKGRTKIQYWGEIEGIRVREEIEFTDEAISLKRRKIDSFIERYRRLGIDLSEGVSRISKIAKTFYDDVERVAEQLGIERHLDNSNNNTFFRGIDPSGRPMFTPFDQFVPPEYDEEEAE